MIELLWLDFLFAALLSMPCAILFFYGLSIGVKKSLSAKRPALLLLFSFVIRSFGLIAFAFLLTRYFEPFSALLAFTVVFLCVRLISVKLAKRRINQNTNSPIATQITLEK